MKLVLTHYLRSMRERDEFDRLLPELLVAMDYVPLFKPQAGIRQHGVDFAAVGESPEDGVRELLLFVIKQGDIGRREWSAGEPADLRPSLIEVLDVYLTTHIAPEYADLRKVVVVATTGDFKQELSLNWKGFVECHQAAASFQFWHGDHVAGLLEKYLLNENLFAAEDRLDLRKALALAGDRDYAFGDFLNLLRRQLGLGLDGSLTGLPAERRQLLKIIPRVNLATQICAHWAQSEGDSRQALWVSERSLLWVWHRILLCEPDDRAPLYKSFSELWSTYTNASRRYIEAMHQHFLVRDGMSGYCRESAEYSLMLFEHIGIVATIGLSQALMSAANQEVSDRYQENASNIVDVLCALIENHPASGSPRLDRNIIDISLALILLVGTNSHAEAKEWLEALAYRLNFSFLRKRMFPIGTDSLDDLVDFEVNGDDEVADAMMSTSWTLSTIAAWCAMLGLDRHYTLLAKGSIGDYANVCGQLWHPAGEWHSRWYFEASHRESGETEAPYLLPIDPAELLARAKELLGLERYEWAKHSPALRAGLWPLDFIACRHFRTPVPPHFWYGLARLNQRSDAGDCSNSTLVEDLAK